MASSTVKGLNVSITADLKGLTAGIKTAESKLKSFGSRVDKFGRSLRNTFSSIFAIGGTGAALVTPFVSFESQMNRVKAITGLAGAEFDKVRKKALLLGKTTELTASEAARGFVQLFKKGQSLEDALTGIDTVLGLVTAGELSAADASKIASAAFQVFGKTGETFVSLGDKMAKTALRSGADVKDFALLISKAGNTAATVGVDFSELSAAFGILRTGAVEASEAATALRNIMQRVSGRSAKALAELSRLDLDFFDNSGKFVGFAEAMERFNRATANMNPKEIGDLSKTLFGSRAAGKALGLASAAEQIRNLKAEVDGAKGTLARFRAELLKGLPGALALMVSSLEQAAISLSTSFSKELEFGANAIKSFANWVAELSPLTKKLSVGVLAIGSGMVLLVVAAGAVMAALKVLFVGTILKFALNFVFVIGTSLVKAFTASTLGAVGLGNAMKLMWVGALKPLLVFAKFLVLIPAMFFAILIVIEKVNAGGSWLWTNFIDGIKIISNLLRTVLATAFLFLAQKLRDFANGPGGAALLAMGVNVKHLAETFLKLHFSMLGGEKKLNKFFESIKEGGNFFKDLSDRAKTTRLEIAKLIESATGFKFADFGKMFFGGDDKKDDPNKENKKKKMLNETKVEAMSLMGVMRSLMGLFDGLNEKMVGKKNAFSEFMTGIGKDLEEYKKTIGTVQEQVSSIIVSSIQQMANGIGEIFAKVIVDGASFFKSAKDLMKSFARSFISQVVSMIAQLLIMAAVQGLVNALTDPTGAKNAKAAGDAGGFAGQVAGFAGGLLSMMTGSLGSTPVTKNERRFSTDIDTGSVSNKKKTEQTIILELDGRQITKTVVENMPSVVRTGSGTIRSS